MENKTEAVKPVYFGITHGTAQLKNWAKTRCVRNEHLFDEVVSETGHYLSCDACGLMVGISHIDTRFVPRRILEAIAKKGAE